MRTGGWGGRQHVADRLQAPLSSPPINFKYPGDGGYHLRGGGDVRVFTLAVLPAHPTQITVLANKVIVQGGEDCYQQNGPQVLPVPKGQGGQVRVISCPHLCNPPRGIHLRQGFLISVTSAAVVSAAAATFGSTSAR